MPEVNDAAPVPDSGASPVEPLTRVLELVAGSSGVHLEPRAAWRAATEALAAGRGDALRCLGLAGRRAGLRFADAALRWPCDPEDLLGGPTLTWIPGPREGRWLIVLGRRGRRFELVLIDECGERRYRLTRAQLCRRIERELIETDDAPLRWLRSEALLPLAGIKAKPEADEAPGPIRRLIDLAKIEREDLWVVWVYAGTIGALSLAVPIAVQSLVNTVAFGSVLQPLVILTMLLAVCLAFVAVLRVLQAVVVEALQRRLFVRTATDFARRFPRLATATRRKGYAPELANRLFDAVALQKTGAGLLLDGLALILQMAVGMTLLAFYHPILLAFDLALLVSAVFVVFVVGRGAIQTSLAESSRKYALIAWIEDLAANPLRFADAQSRAFADARAELLVREWLRSRSEHFRRVVRQLCGGVGLQVLASTTLLGLGGWLVIRRQLTLGQLVAAEIVVTSIGYGLAKLGKQLEGFYDAVTSATKLAKIVDLPLERCGGELLTGTGPIAVSVQRRSGGEARAVLELEPGAKLGLVGRTPAHSELCDLLLGVDTNPAIDVRLDECLLRELDVEALRAEVVLIRDLELFAGSLLDNLDPRLIPSDGPSIRGVLDLVGLGERVDELPEGVQTHLLPTGWPLRKPEARRLMLAQAFIREPRLLIIDGGLDGLGLSATARARVLDRLMAADAPWTLIVVSDDPAVLHGCTQTLESS